MIELEEKQVKDCLKDYLLARGVNLRKNFSCPNPMHEDSNPSAKYYEDSNTVYCHGCNKHYDIFNLIGFEYGLDDKEAYRKGFELYGNKSITNTNYFFSKKNEIKREEKNFKESFEIWHKDFLESEIAKMYIASRGISINTARLFNIGYMKDKKNIVMPTSEHSYNSRNIDNKAFYKEGTSNIFNKIALTNDKTYCIITESEFDCMSFVELGCNAIGLGGVGLINRLFETNLSNDKIYLLALDNDEVGSNATNQLIEQLEQRNLSYLKLDYTNQYKDPNEALTNEFESFQRVCQRIKDEYERGNEEMINNNEKTQYLELNTLNKMKEFEEYVRQTNNMVPYKTGFNELDEALDGGFKEDLVTLFALPGLGKSTFALQVADNVAQSGRDVIMFALEMSRNELISKSLSRISYLSKDRRGGMLFNSNDFLFGYKQANFSEDKLDFIEKSKNKYKEYAEHIFIDESRINIDIDYIKDRIKKHIDITGNTPLVIIDYLQIIKPLKDTMNDKQNIDNIISGLRTLTKELHTCIICISAINRSSYGECLSLASAKESGRIEYDSTIVLGLQYKAKKDKNGKYSIDMEEQQNKDIRDIELRVIKNRFGKTNRTIKLRFCPEFCCFEESNGSLIRNESNTNFF